MKLILASSSPRRKELLKKITDDFIVIESGFDEETIKFRGDVSEYVIELAKAKAEDVSNKIKNEAKYAKLLEQEILIIGCDTVVEIQNNILGKPKNISEAEIMLETLSGNIHRVYSGITLFNASKNIFKVDYACTEVVFSKLSADEIKKYVDSGESLDKAGAYGIQGKAAIFVEEIRGCYYNIVGLPLNKLYKMFLEMGVNLK
ncbi:Maf-like protein [Clostridium guangxiense]|uniref:Maf-like protein n=1 Tax=Clostridium guangxiense TaxID=1662055 RepID=UPI001E53C7FF|nr:Maf-like protein [Clostridium guangxiense]MCD2346214.1 Maf-like protein [Clostridium guangxiense]